MNVRLSLGLILITFFCFLNVPQTFAQTSCGSVDDLPDAPSAVKALAEIANAAGPAVTPESLSALAARQKQLQDEAAIAEMHSAEAKKELDSPGDCNLVDATIRMCKQKRISELNLALFSAKTEDAKAKIELEVASLNDSLDRPVSLHNIALSRNSLATAAGTMVKNKDFSYHPEYANAWRFFTKSWYYVVGPYTMKEAVKSAMTAVNGQTLQNPIPEFIPDPKGTFHQLITTGTYYNKRFGFATSVAPEGPKSASLTISFEHQ